MWTGPGQDPGGGSTSEPLPPSNQELSDLKDQFEQQQVLIAQLKEMLRKSEQTSVTQEKVDKYMNTLSKMNARAKSKGKAKKDEVDKREDNRKVLDTPATEKINLLRQQMEENKLKLAERDKSQKGMEEMVTQLKAQLDDSQQLINQSSLNFSLLDTNKIEYNVNNSSDELYNILITKEKRITDLVNKVHKLESHNLDLQENLKEKDSVIDARTKAITLMTESLSRKGKTTLDTLDDTKEQMRKMQENFVEMENEMKARQLKLLDDLKHKNYEIADLQQTNTILSQEKNELEKKLNEIQLNNSRNMDMDLLKQNLKEFEEKNSELIEENLKLKEKLEIHNVENQKLNDLVQELKSKVKVEDNEEMLKLKKQLDESNKHMIKVKAQQKSKIKELNKKIEAFKNMGDLNIEIVKLESENCKLNQRIVELEEEKGSLQLNLVESDTKKDSGSLEVDQGLKDYSKLLEEKEEQIESIQNELIKLKSENESLTEKLTNLIRLQNENVSSEMKSIQFEEEMDLLQNEKKQLIEQNDFIEKEKEELLEKLEILKKDKQEINLKLDHYIQENIELIDKLEKLSAEKVSSAESIEIVENLTQQEKLELEAYQKNLDLLTTDNSNNLNKSDDNLQTNPELNESVNELTEETSELLTKIELFTVERREVMEKMELLTQENNQLNYKIKEIENNRDTLIETYEQLQNDKEVLDTKYESIQKENIELKEQLVVLNQRINESSNDDDNQELKQLLELKNSLEIDLNNTKEHLKNLQAKVEGNDEEINKFKLLIENYEKEIKELNGSKKELEYKLEDYEKDCLIFEENITELNNNIIDLTREKSNLENDKINYEIKLKELHKKIDELSQQIQEKTEVLEVKDNEILKLIKERDNLENVVENLQEIIKEKDSSFHKFNTEIKEKYLILQQQLNDNSNNLEEIKKPLELKIDELTNKNKEQLEKMKKIAANLKKKTQAYQEIESELSGNQLKYENLIKEKDVLINENNNKIQSLLQQLNELENELTNLQNRKGIEYNNLLKDFELFKENKCQELGKFENENIELQNTIIELKLKLDKMNDINLQQELMQTKEINDNNSLNDDSLLASKIQELELIVETQESELLRSKERINKLEESIAIAEERRINLEKQANELDVQLQEKSISCEEITQSEELLENKLIELTKYDETIEEKLKVLTNENNELIKTNQELIDEKEQLLKKLNSTLDRLKDFEKNENLLDELELENTNLKKLITNYDNEIKQLKYNYEDLLLNNENDLEKIQNDWQQQFNEILNEKNNFETLCEELQKELKDIFEQNNNLNDELNEYRIKLEKSDQEIDEFNKLVSKDNKEEVENLKKMIQEQDKEIENYRKQNLQLQMQNSFNSGNIDLFDDNKSNSNQQLTEELELKKKEIENIHQEIEKYKQRINELETELLNKTTNKPELEIEEKIIKEEKVIPTFNWNLETLSNSSNNQENITSSNNEELLNKIKTLEFMLFNAEKERDDALIQCNQLSNELTQLIYERENSMKTHSSSKELESQIVTDSVDSNFDKHQSILGNLEFEPTNFTTIIDSNQPVVEEIISPKDAYLCYELPQDDNSLVNEEKSANQSLGSQIVIEDPKIDKSELQKLEFEPVKPLDVAQATFPIKEDKCESKEAYKCFNPEGIVSEIDLTSKDAFGGGENDDDGWGWGPESTKLDLIDLENSNKNTLQSKIEQLENKNRVLELERTNHLDEIKNLQIKSGKLIKKFKEIKQKYEELITKTNKDNDDFFNLDNTIQEEFKLQIEKLEKKLKELTNELEKEKQEKQGILKRIDVLTAANERLVELKEKQDVEVLGLQRIQRELKSKLEQYEWGDDGFGTVKEESELSITTKPSNESTVDKGIGDLSKKVKEYEEMIKDLTLDNDELQLLLEEQRTLRINAEKLNKSVPEPSETQIKAETDYLDLLNERNSLNEKINLINDETKQLQSEINNLIKKSDEQLELFNEINKDRLNLNQLIIEKDKIIENLNETLIKIQNENFNLLELIDKNNFEINEMKNRIDLIENEKLDLIKCVDYYKKMESSEKNYIEQIDELRNEKETLCRLIKDKNLETDLLKESMEKQVSLLKIQLNEQTENGQELFNKLNERHNELEELQNQFKITVDNLNKEWELRVDQRGNDVAESWKLHLELKEKEFLLNEENLRKELTDKINNLINENNELRKNVNLEIQNDIDRIGILQQENQEKQKRINELETNLQEKLNETDKEKIEQIKELEIELEQKNIRINELNIAVELTQKQFKDEREIIEEIAKKLENYLKCPVSFEKDDIIQKLSDIINKLINKEEEFLDIQKQLSVTLTDLNEITKKEELSRNNLILIKKENQDLQKRYNDICDELENLRTELQHIQNLKDYENENVQNLQQNSLHYQQLYLNMNTQLNEKNSQYELLSNEKIQLDELVQSKDFEINRLKLLINEKENEFSFQLENLTKDKNLINEKDKEIEIIRKRLSEIQIYYDDLLSKKNLDIENFQQQLNESINKLNGFDKILFENEAINKKLNEKIQECNDLELKISEQNILIEEENNQLNELRGIIEEQVIKIENLKMELYHKSNDYDSLIAQMDIIRTTTTTKPIDKNNDNPISETKTEENISAREEDDLTEPVIRAELDLALYMLHQRDVRCEELTVELTQLLEERDTLQLRLSNALREKEEIGNKLLKDNTIGDKQDSKTNISGAIPKSKTSAIILEKTGTELATEADEFLTTTKTSDQLLANKLSELKTVGYRKDKTIVDEQEMRRLQELSIMQQHRDVASKLPPEAAARLVDASYTLSRDVQSPSKVLLNWLWGRSTPKVNNI